MSYGSAPSPSPGMHPGVPKDGCWCCQDLPDRGIDTNVALPNPPQAVVVNSPSDLFRFRACYSRYSIRNLPRRQFHRHCDVRPKEESDPPRRDGRPIRCIFPNDFLFSRLFTFVSVYYQGEMTAARQAEGSGDSSSVDSRGKVTAARLTAGGR